MKEYIILTIKDNYLFINYKIINKEFKKYVNTSKAINNSFYFSYKYFKNKINRIINILKENYNIESLIIKRLMEFKYPIQIISELKIDRVYFNFQSTMSLSDYDDFFKVECINQVDCYYMPDFIIAKFESRNIKVNLYNNITVSERFMLQQDAFDYETLYYKKNIELKENYPNLIKDIQEFLKINYNLKSIHFYIFSKELIEQIINLIEQDESREIIFYMHQSNDDDKFIQQNLSYLKSINEECKNKFLCEFKIVYSNSYLKNNIFKLLTFSNLKLISLICIYVSLVSLVIIKSYEYVEKMSINELNAELINSSLATENETYDEEQETEIIETTGVYEVDQTTDNNVIPTVKKPVSNKYKFDKVFSKLEKINKDVVSYLTVRNTAINYPVVQTKNNEYYLKKDFYKKNNSMGWIFLDYRNNSKDFDDNNIIYGHSMLNGTMFGTLKKVLTASFRKDEQNMIITLDTANKSYKFKIFSGYRVDYTIDYLQTNFDSKDDFNSFIKLIRGRSDFKTNDKIEYGDKILTLSTCAANGRRLVVHAVLIK